jgi:hypothetical protein
MEKEVLTKYEKLRFFRAKYETRTRANTNTDLNETEAETNTAGKITRACVARNSKSQRG